MLPVIPPAEVEVDAARRYVAVNDAACELLGYTRQELLTKTIDDVSFPSAAHVHPMYARFVEEGSMRGIFALRRKSGDGIMVRFQSEKTGSRSRARWTHYAPIKQANEPEFGHSGLGDAGLK